MVKHLKTSFSVLLFSIVREAFGKKEKKMCFL